MQENEIAKQIVDVAYQIHVKFGPGLLESVYEVLMAHELAKRGLSVTRQQAIPLVYETIHMEAGFRADLIVEDKVIVEISLSMRWRRSTRNNYSHTCASLISILAY